MNKKEFLNKLRKELNNLYYDETSGVVDYYDELIEDTIEKTGKSEDEVIDELGSIDDIVKRVGAKGSRIKYDEYDENEVDECNENEPKKEEVKNNKKTSNINIPLLIIVIVLTCPIWIGIVCGLVGGLIGIYAAGFATAVSSIALCVGGVVLLFTNLTKGIFLIGIGILLLGLSLIIIPLLIKLAKLIIKLVVKGYKWLVKSISSLKEGK